MQSQTLKVIFSVASNLYREHFSGRNSKTATNWHNIEQRCPTLSPIATCGDRPNFLDFWIHFYFSYFIENSNSKGLFNDLMIVEFTIFLTYLILQQPKCLYKKCGDNIKPLLPHLWRIDDHPLDPKLVALVDRWSLFIGSFILQNS